MYKFWILAEEQPARQIVSARHPVSQPIRQYPPPAKVLIWYSAARLSSVPVAHFVVILKTLNYTFEVVFESMEHVFIIPMDLFDCGRASGADMGGAFADLDEHWYFSHSNYTRDSHWTCVWVMCEKCGEISSHISQSTFPLISPIPSSRNKQTPITKKPHGRPDLARERLTT